MDSPFESPVKVPHAAIRTSNLVSLTSRDINFDENTNSVVENSEKVVETDTNNSATVPKEDHIDSPSVQTSEKPLEEKENTVVNDKQEEDTTSQDDAKDSIQQKDINEQPKVADTDTKAKPIQKKRAFAKKSVTNKNKTAQQSKKLISRQTREGVQVTTTVKKPNVISLKKVKQEPPKAQGRKNRYASKYEIWISYVLLYIKDTFRLYLILVNCHNYVILIWWVLNWVGRVTGKMHIWGGLI